MNITHYRKIACYCLLCLITISTLTNCSGWRLRGGDGSVGTLVEDSIYLSGDTSETYQLIQQRLTQKNIISSFTTATQQLVLGKESIKRRSVSLTRGTSTAEYELTLRLPYTIIDTLSQTTIKTTEARVVRSYTFDENDIAGKSKEEALIRRDLQRIAARQILQQLELAQR
ncbi:MAG: LPS assembly lipoprotein LptE [Cellvibrionaceae bacterium]